MLAQLFPIINTVTNAVLLVLLIFYFFYLRIKEKALNKKENKIDADYHKIIDDALSRERKILGDTTEEADKIITGAQYINEATKAAVDQALAKMVEDLKQGTLKTSQDFIKYYLGTLQNMTQQSLGEFQSVSKELEDDLRQQIKGFQSSVLPNIEKEIESYKAARLKQVEGSIQKIVQKVSQEVLNKSIPVEEHERLVVETLEKAKSEGIFD